MTTFPLTWAAAIEWFRKNPVGQIFRIFPHQIQHPKDAGMTPALDMPEGQRTTYRMMITDTQDLVVRDFGTRYEACLELRPTPQGLEKMLTESPGSSVAGAVAAGALLGLLFGRSKDSVLVGAALGGLAGLSGVAVANAKSSPKTSKVAVDLLKTLKETPIPLGDPAKPEVLPAPRPARKKLSKSSSSSKSKKK